MKTLTVTFHCSNNYGSVLQAYALQQALLKLHIENEILDFRYQHDMEQYRLFRTKIYSKKPYIFLYDLICYRKNKKRNSIFDKFREDNLNITSQSYTDNSVTEKISDSYDKFICGSDQIWNIYCTQKYVPEYFLSFAKNKPRIAYAPSLAHSSGDLKNPEILKGYLEKFDYLSVREESGRSTLCSLVDKEVKVVLDPTLLLNDTDYNKIINKENKYRNYIFLYFVEKPSEEMIEYVNQLAQEKSLNILYCSKMNFAKVKNGINIFSSGPSEFLTFIKQADYVVTSSFHATAFSIICRKKFCTFMTKRSFTRTKDLLEKLKLNQRIYTPGFNIEDIIDYESAGQILENEKKQSYDYIKNALGV